MSPIANVRPTLASYPSKARGAALSFGFGGRLGPFERVTKNGLHYESGARGRQPFADTRAQLDPTERKHVQDFIEIVVLLAERERTGERTYRGVVLETQRDRTEGARDLERGLKRGAVRRSRSRQRLIDDGVNREEPIVVLPRGNGAHLEPPPVSVVRGRQVAELQIDAKTPVQVPAGRCHELGPKLGPGPIELAVRAKRGLQVRTHLPKREHSNRRLEGRVKLAVIRDLRRIGDAMPRGPVVQVQLEARHSRSIGRRVVN